MTYAARTSPADDPDRFERELSQIDTIRDAQRHVASNVNMQIVMENLAAQLAGT